MSKVPVLAFVGFLCVASLVNAQFRTTTCGPNVACHPWETSTGPFCGRGNKMNYRFVVDLAPENYYRPQDYNYMQTKQATYAFCPRVDELQAFNLTSAVSLMGMDLTSSAENGTISSQVRKSYLYTWGFGTQNSTYVPPEYSEGRVLIVDNSTESGCPLGCVSVVKFVILNITMDGGKFRFWPGFPQPAGVGFMPSCDIESVCMYDSEMHCVGEPGQKNCAKCYCDPAEIQDMPVQIWASYYGTDSRGRLLRSGANNPMNFRAFSGSGVYASVSTSVDRLKAGKTAQDDQLEP